ncbi:hypothetical protein ACN26Y_26645 [Micromonospora sp. WMMD558]|uniref:hypothetical protein n=1 Tax=unclassified Micromonospora TaxID=2617518 RepID=UPI0012B4A129|nr:hypothetical protein [Micromonospora sp. WMMC415]QGN49518.1 hypothetical protein GKC29_23575 [Micromonospora sp. WMMC415]
MVTVTRGGLALSIAAAIVGPLLAAAAAPLFAVTPATAAPPRAAGLARGALPDGRPLTAAPAARPVGAVAVAAPAPSGAPQPQPPTVFVEVSPSTVQPGFLVGIRASCRDNSIPAVVWSDAFGRVQVQPQHGLLTATPMVRERTLPGNYRVKLECRDGESASTMLQVVRSVRPSRGPATGFGGAAGDAAGGLLLPGGVALTVTGLVVWLVSTRRPRGAARR